MWHPPRRPGTARRPERRAGVFRKILALVRSTVGVDFSDYRDTTIKRRILRRTVLQTGGNLAEYAGLLERDRSEVVALYRDILINVTSFFRDPEIFEVLKDVVFSDDLGGQGGRRAHPHLGAGLLQRPGSLLAGDGTPGVPRGQAGPTPGPDLRHRPQRRDRAEQGAAGGLSREHRGRGVSGTTPPLLHQGSGRLSDRQGDAGDLRLRQAERGGRSAVLPAGPGQLPQRADLPRAAAAEAGHPDLPLRPEPARVPPAGPLGDGRRLCRHVRGGGHSAPDLSEESVGLPAVSALQQSGRSGRRHGPRPARSLDLPSGPDRQREVDHLLLGQYAPPVCWSTTTSRYSSFAGRPARISSWPRGYRVSTC